MTVNEQANQPTEPGPQEPTQKSQAAAPEELADEQLEQVAGGTALNRIEPRFPPL